LPGSAAINLNEILMPREVDAAVEQIATAMIDLFDRTRAQTVRVKR
jgi:hypothetical protein